MNQSIHNVGAERHPSPGLQAFAVEDSGNLGTGMIIQQLVYLIYCAVGGPSPVPGIQRRRDCQALCGATPKPHVQHDAVPLDDRHVLNQQTNHTLAFPVGQSRVVPDLPKVGC